MSLIVLSGAGCRDQPVAQGELPAPMVTVAHPVEATVTRYEYSSGRAQATAQVEVRARVSGPLTQISFVPGSEVKAGSPLFLIDPVPFRVSLMQADAEVATATARLQTATADEARAK